MSMTQSDFKRLATRLLDGAKATINRPDFTLSDIDLPSISVPNARLVDQQTGRTFYACLHLAISEDGQAIATLSERLKPPIAQDD